MTVAVSNTLANSTTTVGNFRTRVNEIATALSNVIVTTNSNTATGNAAITGTFESSVLVANSIGGGNTGTSNTLYATSPVQFNSNATFLSHSHLGVGSNVHVLVGNATHRFMTSVNGGVNGISVALIALADMSDFAVGSPANNQVLVYSNAIGKWVNQTGVPTANNSTYFGGSLPAFYQDAGNMNAGTLPPARLTGAYGNVTAVGNLTLLTVTGNAVFNHRVGIGNLTPSVSLHVTANDAIFVPVGNTLQRPSGANGMFRYNAETSAFEGFIAGAWSGVSSFLGGTLTSKLSTVASNTTNAGLNVPAGAAPSSPVDGDFWSTTTAAFIRINGSTKTVAFLEGGTFTGLVTFSANLTTQNVTTNYVTSTQVTSNKFLSGNATVNAVINSTSLALANSTVTGTLVIADLAKEYFLGTVMGVMSQHNFPITLINYSPVAVTINLLKFKLDSGSFTNTTFLINGVPINNAVSKAANTTLQTFTPTSNNVLAVGGVLTVDTNGDSSDWNLSIYIEATK